MNLIISKLLAEVEDDIINLKDDDYFNEELRISSNALLHYYYRYSKRNTLIGNLLYNQINENIEICREKIIKKSTMDLNGYSIIQQLPLFIINLLNTNDEDKIEKYNFLPLICHHNSNVRGVTCYCLWNIKEILKKEKIIKALIVDIGDTLGFVDEAIGLLAGILNDEKELYSYAEKYKESVELKDQLAFRINQLKGSNSISLCKAILEREELILLEKIENISMFYD